MAIAKRAVLPHRTAKALWLERGPSIARDPLRLYADGDFDFAFFGFHVLAPGCFKGKLSN